MRKRFACVLMALVMVIAMVPAMVTPADAASDLSSSEEIIGLIKKFEGFSATAYWDTDHWSVGYGTAGTKGQTITKKKADKEMRAHMSTIDEKINAFADKYGLEFDQSMHDALAAFSYNVGTGWMKSSGRFRDAVVEGASNAEFLFYITLWANIDSVPERGLIVRRLCEANIYLFDDYSTSLSDNLSYVILDPNGGMAGSGGEDKMQGYLVNKGAPILAADPEKPGATFVGWFTQRNGGEQVTRLDKSTALATLYAHYEGGAEEKEDEFSEVIATGKVVCDTYVNVRNGAGIGYGLAGRAVNGTEVDIYEIKTVGALKWGKTMDGWICLDYVLLDGEEEPEEEETAEEETEAEEPETEETEAPEETDEPEEEDASEDEEAEYDEIGQTGVVVNANVVNVRGAAGTDNPVVSTLKVGSKVMVHRQVTIDKTPWGQIDQGWICMNYVRLNADEFEEKTDLPEPVDAGKVSSTTNLNVRSGPGTEYNRVNFLTPGTRVTVYEIRTVRGEKWGQVGDGRWVCLSYVTLDSDKDEEPEQPDDEAEETDSDALFSGKVNSSTSLNVRSGPGTDFNRVKTLKPGTSVTVYEEKEAKGVRWGRIDEKNWVCLSYISINSNTDTSEEKTGRVISNTVLYIRSNAGKEYNIVGWLNPGTKVTVLEQKKSGSLTWGRISGGWVCMSYIRTE